MKNKLIYIILTSYSILAVISAFYFSGTGDTGDSITHYLFARYAPQHPENFFNHWAKPVFTLLACPFAQFGFIGMKLFNVLVAIFTIFFTYKTSVELKLKNALFAAVIFIFTPLYFVSTFSGLTDPLFALFLSISIFLILKNKWFAAALIISFMPFVRSEGMIIAGVFGLFYLIKKEWKYLPLFLVGHVVYSIAGYFVYHDFLWIFTENPYSRLDSYGTGGIFYFAVKLVYVVGIPIYILFGAGVLSLIIQWFRRKINLEIQLLIFLGFMAFFTAHTLFWYFGIFHSMGLIRVMIGVMPLIAIIALEGYNFLTETFFKNNKKIRHIVQGILIIYVLIFPFTPNPASINWKKDMSLDISQQSAVMVAEFLKKNIQHDYRIFDSHPYLAIALNYDLFDRENRRDLKGDFLEQIQPGDILIWDNWFSMVEHGTTHEMLDTNNKLMHLYSTDLDEKHEIVFSVYQVK